MPDDTLQSEQALTTDQKVIATQPNQETSQAPVQGQLQPPTAPQTALSTQNPTPAPTAPVATPAAVQNTHETMLGKAAKFLMGTSYQYQIDPKTGQTVSTPIKQKPGDMFRSILAGAILGGAAAESDPNPNKDFGSGLVVGGAGAIGDARRQDELRRSQAQQQFQNQRAAQAEQRENQAASRADQELKLRQREADLQSAHWEKELVMQQRDFNLRDQEFLQRTNEWNQGLEDKFKENGGYLAPFTGNGEVGNSGAIAKQVTTNSPSIKPPAGYTRSTSQVVDMNGLKQDPEKGWVDEQGNPVDLKDRTKVSVYFTPINTEKQIETHKGTELMKLFPHVYGKSLQGDNDYPISMGEYKGLATTESQMSRQESNDSIKRQHENLMVAYDAAKNDWENLGKQLVGLDPNDPQAQDIRARMEKSRQEMDDVAHQMNPHLRPATPVAGTTPTANPTVPTVDERGQTLPRPAAEVQAEQDAVAVKKSAALALAAPAQKAHVANPMGDTSVPPRFDKEIPHSKAVKAAQDAGMSYEDYAKLAEQNGHVITRDPAISRVAVNPQTGQQITVYSSDGGKTWSPQAPK